MQNVILESIPYILTVLLTYIHLYIFTYVCYVCMLFVVCLWCLKLNFTYLHIFLHTHICCMLYVYIVCVYVYTYTYTYTYTCFMCMFLPFMIYAYYEVCFTYKLVFLTLLDKFFVFYLFFHNYPFVYNNGNQDILLFQVILLFPARTCICRRR